MCIAGEKRGQEIHPKNREPWLSTDIFTMERDEKWCAPRISLRTCALQPVHKWPGAGGKQWGGQIYRWNCKTFLQLWRQEEFQKDISKLGEWVSKWHVCVTVIKCILCTLGQEFNLLYMLRGSDLCDGGQLTMKMSTQFHEIIKKRDWKQNLQYYYAIVRINCKTMSEVLCPVFVATSPKGYSGTGEGAEEYDQNH